MENLEEIHIKKISVIIPMYNCENTISNTIESVLKQNDQNFEIVLINDGSTDNTMENVNKIVKEAKGIIKVFSQKNNGVSSARNLGIYHSHGEYVCFLDSDDTQKDNFFKSMREVIKNSDVDLVIGKIEYSNIINPEVDNNIYSIKGRLAVSKQVPILIKEGIFNSMVNKLYKKSIINNNTLKLDNTLSIGEDFDFNLNYIKHCYSISVNNQYVYIYHLENSKLTKTVRENEFFIRLKNVENLEKFYEENDIKINLDFQYVKIFYADLYNELRKGTKKKDIKKRIRKIMLEEQLLRKNQKKGSIVELILVNPIHWNSVNCVYFVAKFSYLARNIKFLKRNQISI